MMLDIFTTDLKRWQKKMTVVLTVECRDDDTECHIGLVTKHIPNLKFSGAVSEAAAITVGPPVMIKFAVQALKAAVFSEENIWISLKMNGACETTVI